MNFTHRGLHCTCSVTPRVPATWLQPPEGGEVEDLEWEVDDIDEVLEYAELDEGLENMIRGFFKICNTLPRTLVDKIDREWNIEDAAYEAAADYDPRDDYED